MNKLNIDKMDGIHSKGFTLLEVMVVVVILAILAAISVSVYSDYVVRTKRTAGASCLSQYASYMERYYATNLSYDTAALPVLGCAGPDQTQGYYNYSLTSASTSAYVLHATPLNGQLRDSKCGVLTLNQTGTRGKTGTGSVGDCW